MLYSILPPIIVILSFVAVIIFLFRKSSQVAKLREAETLGESEENGSLWKKLKTKHLNFSRLKFWFWSFLEKLTKKTRVLFLKLESSSGKISNRIREKRNKKKEEKEKDVTLERLKQYEFTGEESKIIQDEPGKAKIKSRISEEEEKPVKPMISDKVVSPRSRSEIKDILEDVLIERIAVNPRDLEAYERLGEYYLEVGNFEHAKECIKQVLKLDPTNRNAKYKMKRLERMING